MSIKTRVAEGAIRRIQRMSQVSRHESLPAVNTIADNYRLVSGRVENGQFTKITKIFPLNNIRFADGGDFLSISLAVNEGLYVARMPPGIDDGKVLTWWSEAKNENNSVSRFRRNLLRGALQPAIVEWESEGGFHVVNGEICNKPPLDSCELILVEENNNPDEVEEFLVSSINCVVEGLGIRVKMEYGAPLSRPINFKLAGTFSC